MVVLIIEVVVDLFIEIVVIGVVEGLVIEVVVVVVDDESLDVVVFVF